MIGSGPAGTNEAPIYVDLNILIYAMEMDGHEAALARGWLVQAERGEFEVVTSGLTIVEVPLYPISQLNQALIDGYRRPFTAMPSVRLAPVTPTILFRVAELGVSLKAGTLDAIHVATALEAGCRGFLTNDERLKLPPGLLRCRLPDVSDLQR